MGKLVLKSKLKEFFKEEKGDVVQYILVIGISLGIAITLRDRIRNWVTNVDTNVNSVMQSITPGQGEGGAD